MLTILKSTFSQWVQKHSILDPAAIFLPLMSPRTA